MRYYDADAARKKALSLYERGAVQVDYLQGDTKLFPLYIRFKRPSERVIRSDFELIRKAIKASESAGLPLEYQTFRFAALGQQRLPVGVVFETRETYLKILGLEERFDAFVAESKAVLEAFPSLHFLLIKKPKLIENHSDAWGRLVAVCRYLIAHPNPHIYLRELPIEGVDTKFIASHKKVLDLLLTHLLPAKSYDATIATLSNGGFEAKYGFLTPEPMIRFRLLDPADAIAGQMDLSLPKSAFDRLTTQVERIFVVENLATFLAFPHLPKSMVIFGSGYGARYLKDARWMTEQSLYYWGDLDSHGFAILSQFRTVFPNTHSFIMDQHTADRFAHLAVEEPKEKRYEGRVESLSEAERRLFETLRHKAFRLEQERIPIGYVQERLCIIAP